MTPTRRSGRARGVVRSFAVLPALMWLALSWIAGPPLAAQLRIPDSQVIRSIEIQGLQSLTPETVRYYLGVEEGQELDQEELNRNIQALWQRDLIGDIEIDSVAEGDGIRLIVKIEERPVLRSIDYQGLKKLKRGDIREVIVTERIDVREGGPLKRGELNRLAAAIQQAYKDKGYRFAAVRFEIEEISPGERRAVYTIDEGDRVRIQEIDFEGNTVYSDLRLRSRMRKVRESGPLSRLLRRDIYNPAGLEEDLDKVKTLYRNSGYKNVLLGEPEIRVDEVGGNEDKRRIFLTVPVEEGERWRFGEITIEGNETYSDQALLRVFQNKSGSWLKANLIDDGIESVTDLYKNTGYMFASIEPELRERDNNVADVRVKIDEGEQFTVGRVEFKGNTRTKDKVLRREVRLQEGFVMNLGALRSSVYKVNQLGYFQLDEEDPVQVDVDSEEQKVNLTFEGEEADRTELQFGGGWSEFDGFFGQFAIRTQNFLGRGESVQASFQSGRLRTQFDLGYFVPYFLDKPQTVGIRIFKSEQDFSSLSEFRDFRQDQEGIQLTYGRNLSLFQSFAVNYTFATFEDTQSFFVPGNPDGDPPTEDEFITLDRDIESSSIRPVWSFNSIDNRFEPTRGRRISFSTEYSGGALGGNNEFVRPEASFSLFKPLNDYPTKHVFAMNAEIGYIEPFGDGLLSVFEYYVLGGERSIRGHARRSLFPRDETGNLFRDSSGLVIGGDRFAQLNLEYHYLAGGPFRMILFADAAQAWAPGATIDAGDLRYTAGAELRVLVPVFGAPLRFIYAFNLNPEPFDQFESFQFTIGSSF
ncbi:MAG: outer membrane protein assembly factor BamA [Acidobacteriota bacterium]